MGSSFSNSGDVQPRGHGQPSGARGRGVDAEPLAVPVSHGELRRWMILDQLPLALDLLPSRGHPLGMFLTGGAAISILVGLFLGLGAEHPSWRAESLHAFTLEGPGNVASWFSTLVLTAAGLCCVIVWWLEGIAEDEDVSPSKAWLLGALFCCLMGLDESVGLHTLLTEVLAARAERWGDVSPQHVWMVLYGVAWVAFGLRVFPLMAGRRSLLAILLLMGAAGAYLLSALVQAVPRLPLPAFPDRELWEEVPELAGHWLVLMGFTCHAQRLLRGLLRDDHGSESAQDADARLSAFRELLQRRNEDVPQAADSREFSDDADAAWERGDFLIIHPPHGRNRSRAVNRVIRRRTAATGRTKRSDLDPPVIVAPVIPPSPSFSNAAVQPTMPAASAGNAGGLNAFLAGMAYAETQRATAQLQNPPAGFQSPPQAAAWGNQGGNALNYGWNPGQTAVAPASTSPQVSGVGSPGHPAPNAQSPRSNVGFGYGDNLYAANVTHGARTESAASPVPNTAPQGGNSFPADPVSQISTNGGNAGSALGNSSMPGTGNSDPSPAVVNRKLTKEEKKRLRELYERRLAQQGQSVGG